MMARGFTLIEVMVSFTLLSVVLAASYQGYAQGPESDARAQIRIESVQKAEARLAVVRAGIAPLQAAERRDGPWRETVTIEPGPVPALWQVSVEVAHDGHGPVRLDTMVLLP